MNMEQMSSGEAEVRQLLTAKIQERVSAAGQTDRFSNEMVRTTVQLITKRLAEMGQPLTKEELEDPRVVALIDYSINLRLEGGAAADSNKNLEITPDRQVQYKEPLSPEEGQA